MTYDSTMCQNANEKNCVSHDLDLEAAHTTSG